MSKVALCLAGALVVFLQGVAFADANSKWLGPDKQALLDTPERLPFFPHRANTSDNAVLSSGMFDDAEVCGTCHQEIYAQWRTSAMARSWDDPIYRALLKKASEATDGAVDNFCTGCHTPVGLTTGKITSAVNRASVEETAESHPMPGVDCEACHNINARTGIDNGAYVLAPRSRGGRPTKYGPRSDAESPYHETVYSELHTRSDFCGTCHNVTHPFNGVAIERTYDEWLESEYAVKGIDCQSCHMAGFKGKAAIMGPERDDVASHWFAGANATLLSHFGDDEAAQMGSRMLQSAAQIEIVEQPQSLAPGELANFTVEVHNTGAGHKLPTGFPEGREVWIDFEVSDATGKSVYRLGQVRNGRTEPGTRNFRVHLGDKDGNEVEYAVWDVTHIISDNRILPNGKASAVFAFIVPEGAVGPLKAKATLRYWPFPQGLVDELVGEGKVDVKITDMTRTQVTVPMAVERTADRVDASGAPQAASHVGKVCNAEGICS